MNRHFGKPTTRRAIPTDSAGADRLLNVEEAAAVLGLKPLTLYTWASERRIPTVKIGRALRIRLSVVFVLSPFERSRDSATARTWRASRLLDR